MSKGFFQYPGMAAEERTFLKAALHTHTTGSDGQFTPEQAIDLYKKAGYDVLAFSDHRYVNKVSALDGKGMTLICGAELHPKGPCSELWHILALNLPEDFAHTHPATGQEAIDAVREAGGMAFIAHPHWCGFTPSDILALHGFSGMEVFNTSCCFIGKEYSMEIWDGLMDAGCPCPALAVDDMHVPGHLFRGWTMIAAKSNHPADVADALSRGTFYASEGPEIRSLRIHDGIFEAEFSPCSTVVFAGQRWRGECGLQERRDVPGAAKTITSFRIELARLPKGLLRFQIRDEKGKYAWCNPFLNSNGGGPSPF